MNEKKLLQQWFNGAKGEGEQNLGYLRFSWWTRNASVDEWLHAYLSYSCPVSRTHMGWYTEVPTEDIVKEIENRQDY